MTSKADSDYQLTVLDPSYSSNLAQCHSYSPDTLVPHCNPTTRLLSKLDKNSIIQLVIDWLKNSKDSISILPPILTNSPSSSRSRSSSSISSSSSAGEAHQDLSQQDLIAAKHLINNKTCNSFNQLFHLWNVSMRNPKVPKIRAIERIFEVDWPKGFSYHMLAQIDGKYLTSSSGRTWNAIKLIYSDENKIPSPSPTQLQQSFSSELSHYFSHHLHLYSKQEQGSSSSSSESTNSLDDFIHFRLVAAPSALDLSCPNPLHILMIPKSPFALVSGIPASNASGGGASELRSMSFSALAQAMGSIGIRLPGNLEVRGSIGKDKNKEIGNENEEQEKLQKKKSTGTGGDLPELKGKDPMALRSILLGTLGDIPGSSTQGSIPLGGGGGKSRGLKRGDLEENPLIHSEKRIKRENSISIRLDQNPNSSTELELGSNKMTIERILVEKEENDVLKGFSREFRHPAQLDKERKKEKRNQWDRDREVGEVFGRWEKEDQDGDLPKVERIDYELHLPFPAYTPYHQPESLSTHLKSNGSSSSSSISNREPIRLRLEGSHVLAGLRQLIHSGLDRRGPTEESSTSSSTTTTTSSGTSSESRHRVKKIHQEARGLPDWLTRVEGTKVVVGTSSDKRKR